MKILSLFNVAVFLISLSMFRPSLAQAQYKELAEAGSAIIKAKKEQRDQAELARRFARLESAITQARDQILNEMRDFYSAEKLAQAEGILFAMQDLDVIASSAPTRVQYQSAARTVLTELIGITRGNSRQHAFKSIDAVNTIGISLAVLLSIGHENDVRINAILNEVGSTNYYVMEQLAPQEVLSKIQVTARANGSILTLPGLDRISCDWHICESRKKEMSLAWARLEPKYRDLVAYQQTLRGLNIGIPADPMPESLSGYRTWIGRNMVLYMYAQNKFCGFMSMQHLILEQGNGRIPDLAVPQAYTDTLKYVGACYVKIPKGYFTRPNDPLLYYANDQGNYCQSATNAAATAYDFDIIGASKTFPIPGRESKFLGTCP